MAQNSNGVNKKNVFLWTLYDFANSITNGVFSLYFSEWLVIDKGVKDIWFNLIFVASTVLLVVTAPVLGLIADKRGVKIPYLRMTTALQFVFLFATSILAVAFPAHRTVIFLSALAYMLGNYFYQFTFTFYNPLLADIAPAKSQGLVSGIGQFANFVGIIFGIFLTLPLVTGAIYLFGNSGRAQAFWPSTVAFFIIALPLLIFYKEKPPLQIKTKIKEEYKSYISSLVKLVKLPGMGRYLLAFFFFNDAMLTAVNNFPIFLDQVYRVPDNIKALMAAAIFGMAAVGGLAAGWIGDRIGLKRSLLIILGAWTIVFPILGVLKNFPVFVGFCVIVGLLYGATWAVTRAIMVYLSPTAGLNHAFSYYTLFERFSTFVGPVAWGLIATLLVHSGPLRYRIAMASMGVFVFIGLVIVRKIPSKRIIE